MPILKRLLGLVLIVPGHLVVMVALLLHGLLSPLVWVLWGKRGVKRVWSHEPTGEVAFWLADVAWLLLKS